MMETFQGINVINHECSSAILAPLLACIRFDTFDPMIALDTVVNPSTSPSLDKIRLDPQSPSSPPCRAGRELYWVTVDRKQGSSLIAWD